MADNILQGTTPTLAISIDPVDLSLDNVKELELTFRQHNKEPTIKHLNDCMIDVDNNTIAYHFSEIETHAFHPAYPLEWQLRILTQDDEIVGTKKAEISISDLISSEVMTQ